VRKNGVVGKEVPFCTPLPLRLILFFELLNRQALTDLNKLGEVTSRLKELEVTLEFAEISKQRAEGEATLAKERAESASREVKRLELLVLFCCPLPHLGLN
jgi:hypothetical protein